MRNLKYGTLGRIGEIWQENDTVKKSRCKVDLNYFEVFLIQLRIPVIFTGFPTGSGKPHAF